MQRDEVDPTAFKLERDPNQTGVSAPILQDENPSRIYLITDSQGRDIALELQYLVAPKYRVFASVCPNATLDALIPDILRKRGGLQGNDIIIVLAGTNNTHSNYFDQRSIAYMNAVKTLRRNTKTHQVWVYKIPPRFDDPEAAEHVKSLNQQMERYKRIMWLDPPTQRHHFTKQGLHLNPEGKSALAMDLAHRLSQRNRPLVKNHRPRDTVYPKEGLHASNTEARAKKEPKKIAASRKFDDHLRFYLDVQFGGETLRTLIDSGSTHTLVNARHAKRIGNRGVQIKNHRDVIAVANGSTATISKKGVIPVNIGDHTWVGDVYFVDNLPYNAVIGIDVLRALKVTISFHDGIMRTTANSMTRTHSVMHLAGIAIPVDPESQTPVDIEKGTMNEEEFESAKKLISGQVERFKLSPGKTDVVEHRIYLKDPNRPPIKQRYYNYSPATQEAIEAQISEWLEEGVIEPSNSPYSFPLLAVEKKDTTKKRVCVDLRRLNEETVVDAYPLPRIQHLLDQLKSSNFVSTMDLRSGFLQIGIHPESRKYLAFSYTCGHYQFKRLPFGLNNAPAAFQNCMNTILRPVLYKSCLVYLDDIIVFSSSLEQHKAHLQEIFDLLFSAGMAISWKKSHFFKRKTEFLGYTVGEGKVMVSSSKTESVRNFPVPHNLKTLRGFLGLSGWYHRFVPQYATVAAPLTQLLHKDTPFEWKEEQQRAFDTIKNALVEAPNLYAPDYNREFVIHSDASSLGSGAVLLQVVDGEERVIAFTSKTFSKAERNYSVTELECLAVIHSLEAFRCYIEGKRTKVVTDHASLVWLMKIPQPQGRLARWILRISQFNVELIHRKGKDMVVPDTLSRIPFALTAISLDMQLPDFDKVVDEWYLKLCDKVRSEPTSYPQFHLEGDYLFKKIYDPFTKSHSSKLYLPYHFRHKVITQQHSEPYSAHLGFKKTEERVKRQFYWPSMSQDIRHFISCCPECQKHKATNQLPLGKMGTEIPRVAPFNVLCVDFVGPLPRSRAGNCYILTILDSATKYLFAVPVRNATTAAAIKAITEHVFLEHGLCTYIVADNGSTFASKQFKEFCESFNVQLQLISKYSPSNNPVERSHRVIKDSLSAFIHQDQRDWDIYLKYIIFAIRNSINETTGFSPAELVFGRKPKGFASVFDPLANAQVGDFDPKLYNDTVKEHLAHMYQRVRKSMQKAKTHQAKYYNLRHRPKKFEVGEQVLHRNFQTSKKIDHTTKKFLPKFVGPYRVAQVLHDNHYVLEDKNGKSIGKCAIENLLPFTNPISEIAPT